MSARRSRYGSYSLGGSPSRRLATMVTIDLLLYDMYCDSESQAHWGCAWMRMGGRGGVDGLRASLRTLPAAGATTDAN